MDDWLKKVMYGDDDSMLRDQGEEEAKENLVLPRGFAPVSPQRKGLEPSPYIFDPRDYEEEEEQQQEEQELKEELEEEEEEEAFYTPRGKLSRHSRYKSST